MTDPIRYMLGIMEHTEQLRLKAEEAMTAIDGKSQHIGRQLSDLTQTAQEVRDAGRRLGALIAEHVETLAALDARRRKMARMLPISACIVAVLVFGAGFTVPVILLAARYGHPLSGMLSLIFGT